MDLIEQMEAREETDYGVHFTNKNKGYEILM